MLRLVPEPTRSARQRVLVVGDGAASPAEGLVRAGPRFAVIEAPTTRDALDRLGRETFDVALLAPGLDAHEALRALVAVRAARPDLPIVVALARGEAGQRARALDLGAQDVLLVDRRDERPVDRVIEDAIERHGYAIRAKQASTGKYHAILHTLTNGLCITDATGQILEVNGAACSMSGYDYDELLHMRVESFGTTDDLEATARRLARVRDLGGDRFETALRRKDGAVADIAVSASHVDLDGGLFVFALEDVTVRKRAEAELRASEERFRTVFEDDSVGRVINGTDRRVIAVNAAFCRMVGYTAQELVGASLEPITHPDDLCGTTAAVRSLLFADRADACFEKRYLAKDGRVVHALVSGVLLRDAAGAPLCFASTIQDISERKRAEDALRAFKLGLDRTTDAVLVTATDGAITYVNEAFVGLYGYASAEVLGATARRLAADAAGEAEPAPFWETVRADRPVSYEAVARTKGGRIVHVQTSANAIVDEGGRVVGIIAMQRDVTALRRREAVTRIRLALHEYASRHTLSELLQETLDQIGAQTGSPVGFYHFVEPDQVTLSLQAWSTRTLAEFCKTEGRGLHYGIAEAGVWVDCVRERRTVIHNDYASLPHRKGLPPGHAPVQRELVVPIFREGRIVAIVGIGNKPTDYTDEDVETVTHLADVTWEVAERKRAEEAQARAEAEWRTTFDAAGDAIGLLDAQLCVVRANRAMRATLAPRGEDVAGRPFRELVSAAIAEPVGALLERTLRGHRRETIEVRAEGPCLEATADPIAGDDGRVAGAVLWMRDTIRREPADEA